MSDTGVCFSPETVLTVVAGGFFSVEYAGERE